MFERRTDSTVAGTAPAASVEPIKGPSLARGPAWIVGLVLSIAGLALFFRAPGTPLGTGGFPDGAATGDTFLGFEANAWTAWGTTAAGVLVLIGAAQHALAKLMSLITGVGLAAAAIIAAIDGDVLGLAAANFWTMLGWAIASGILLITALLPRVNRDVVVSSEGARPTERIVERDRPVVAPAPAAEERAPAAPAEPAPVAYADNNGDRSATPADQPAVRSEPLRRTYQERNAQPTEAELEAARRARTEQSERLR